MMKPKRKENNKWLCELSCCNDKILAKLHKFDFLKRNKSRRNVSTSWSPWGEAISDKWPAPPNSKKWTWTGNNHHLYGTEDTSKTLCWKNFSVSSGVYLPKQPQIQVEAMKMDSFWSLVKRIFIRGPIGIKSGSLWTSEFSVSSINLSSGYQRSLEDSTLDIEFTSIFCFIISTLLVFLFSLALALVTLKCYDYFKARNTQVFGQTTLTLIIRVIYFFKVSRFLCSSPPSYNTIAKIDRTELPTYKQACKFSLEKL